MTAGPVTGLRTQRVAKYSFTVEWNPAKKATQGYSIIVRDLNNHTQVRSEHTTQTSITISGLEPSTLYNFGIQGLPGGRGSNLRIETTSGVTNANAQANRGTANPLPVKQTTYKAFAMSLMVRHGWGLGYQWTAFQNVEMAEAGWNALDRNPASGAFGIAQALGHGTANTAGRYGNEYGGMNLPDAVNRAANSGNGYAQLMWMCNYIAARWGNPAAAWANEQSNHWY